MPSSGDKSRERAGSPDTHDGRRHSAMKHARTIVASTQKLPPDTGEIEIGSRPIPHRQPVKQVSTQSAHDLAHDDPEFDALCEQYYTPLYYYVLRRVGDPGYAEDIVQETLLDASAKWHTLQRDNEMALLKWLYTTARNNFIDHCRREDIRSRRWSSYEQTLTSQPDETDPFLAIQIEEEIWQTLGELPERERECILLVCQDGYPIEEAAALLHIQPSSVRGYLSRGREKFRKMYQAMQTTFFRGGTRKEQNGRNPR